MSKAPERIWAWCFQSQADGDWGDWGGYARQDNRFPMDAHERTNGAEYVRADLAPAPSVSVKPLEWEDVFASVDIPEGYSLYENSDGTYSIYMVYRTGSYEMTDQRFQSENAAKAAAQADYEARVLAAIQIGPKIV